MLFPIKPGSSRGKGQQGELSCEVVAMVVVGRCLILLVIDTRAVNTLGCGPDSLTRPLFTHPLNSRKEPTSSSSAHSSSSSFIFSSFPLIPVCSLSLWVLLFSVRPGKEHCVSAGGCVHVCPEFEPRVLYANDLRLHSLFSD